ncbi:MAG TPA: L,D-transpeptidase [Solirubrobacter sp.]|nr:L,D-transpeptidase [Solirubrobacter sp.]
MRAPSLARGAWVAKLLHGTRARRTPGATGGGWALPATVADDGYHPQELLVLGRPVSSGGRDWLRVRLPRRPNDASGWIPADAVRLRHTDRWVRVRLKARTVSLYRGGRLALRTRAVIGAGATPTPRGLFAVLLAARQKAPRGFLGPWAIHLTAHSDVLDDYGGGQGRVAIHGRGAESLLDPLGSARSHGCVRVPNDAVSKLATALRPGTPVQITE